eukprot:Skav231363  [mRNA]  locus=scaffold1586:379570:385812:+ [translate_table: standard]
MAHGLVHGLVLGAAAEVTLYATLYSISKGSLSRISGLDWELWLGLFALNALSMLIQAFVAVGRLNVGRTFRWAAFAEASFLGMAPVISDQFDTVKDILFAGLCFQAESSLLHVMGMCSLLYLLFIHFYFLSSDSTLAELAASHIPVVLVASSAAQPEGTSRDIFTCCQVLQRKVLPMLYKQTTPTRHGGWCCEVSCEQMT